jgi:Cft2 family RNA processing exonuclease
MMEATYGDRDHGPMDQMEGKLAAVIKDAVERRGKIIIPVSRSSARRRSFTR